MAMASPQQDGPSEAFSGNVTDDYDGDVVRGFYVFYVVAKSGSTKVSSPPSQVPFPRKCCHFLPLCFIICIPHIFTWPCFSAENEESRVEPSSHITRDRDKKIGHRRVDKSGIVSYKKGASVAQCVASLALRSAETLLLCGRAQPLVLWPDRGPESLRSPDYG
ncbi:hypothetical protein PoB_000774100 [Plakobranchus ocellatus]|uniref:Uncharacterized protein n=1 Tax=Plakobranchus ocellatus TaxID=259542 RepID=A0AAV3YFT1_9GAST|nr:hypothetical protein PoB_000774100 [Plakobranchus ocellatus]